MAKEKNMQEMIVFKGTAPEVTTNVDLILSNVKNRLEALKIDTMEATEDNLNSLRAIRAELRKETSSYNSEKSRIRGLLLRDYEKVTKEIDSKVIKEYDKYDTMLKKKIDSVMQARKDLEIEEAKAYFANQYEAARIEFIKFEHIKVDYKNPTRMKRSIDSYFEEIKSDLDLIDLQTDSTEILAEYLINGYDSKKAITVVNERNERIKALENTSTGSYYDDNEVEVIEEVIELEDELIFEEITEEAEEIIEPEEELIESEEAIETEEKEDIYLYEIAIEATEHQMAKILDFIESNGIVWRELE